VAKPKQKKSAKPKKPMGKGKKPMPFEPKQPY
jgi:hypothetical protein